MSNRAKWMIVMAAGVLMLGIAVIVGVGAWQQYQERQGAPSDVETAAPVEWDAGSRIVFRNTAVGQGYGLVASVPLDAPDGPRALTDIACDRVAAQPQEFVCLRSERGIVPSYDATVYANAGEERGSWPLPGIPSRTRFSPDGALVATTAFVTGHSYATVGFSTETVIRTDAGESLGDLEDFTLIIDGEPVAPVDRNYWGVTFVDDETFYATAGMALSGQTYLVRGDLTARTLTSLAEGIECPSLSPDGTRIAFKRVTSGPGAAVHWAPAVMDLSTGEFELLPEERSVDDQIAWLDDSTVMYGLPREDGAGDTDVWAAAANGTESPSLLIEHAWSPTVVER